MSLRGRRLWPRVLLLCALLGSLTVGVSSVSAAIPNGTYTFNSTLLANSTWQFVLTTIEASGNNLSVDVDYRNVSDQEQGIDCATQPVGVFRLGNPVYTTTDPCNTIPSPDWHDVPPGVHRWSSITFANTLSPNTTYTLDWQEWGRVDFTINVAAPPPPPPPTDKTPPVITNVPSSITAAAQDSGGALVTYSIPTATDKVDGRLPVYCDWPSGSKFPVGTTVVTCTATDKAGNKATTHFNVTVTPPAPAPPGSDLGGGGTSPLPNATTNPPFFTIAADQQHWDDLTPTEQAALRALFDYINAASSLDLLVEHVRIPSFTVLNPCFLLPPSIGFATPQCAQALAAFWFTAPAKTVYLNGKTLLAVGVGAPGVLSAAQVGARGAISARSGHAGANRALLRATKVTASRGKALRVAIRPTLAGRRLLARKRSFRVPVRLTWKPRGGGPSRTVVHVTVYRHAR